MRNRKDWSSLLAVQKPSADVQRTLDSALLTATEHAIRDAVAALKPFTRFKAIGEQIGKSRAWVSREMQERFRNEPGAMWKIGQDWHIPRQTAELWIREIFD
jgi:hypothetical protein